METITLCKYETNGIEAAAVYKPKTHAQARFAPRFSNDRECKMFKQSALERLVECILTHYPSVRIEVVNKKPWE